MWEDDFAIELSLKRTLRRRIAYIFLVHLESTYYQIFFCSKIVPNLRRSVSLRPGWLDYDNLCVFEKSLFQPEYRILKKAFAEQLHKKSILRLFDNQNEIMQLNLSPVILLEEMSKHQKYKSNIQCKFLENASDVPDPRSLSPEKKNLMVLDDLLLESRKSAKRITLEVGIVTWTLSI